MKKGFVQTLLAASLAAVGIAAVLTYSNPARWLNYFITSFVFSFLMAFINRSLFNLFDKFIERAKGWLRLLVILAIVLIGTTVGTEIGLFILGFIPGTRELLKSTVNAFLLSLVFVLIISSVMFAFITLRKKNEQMAEKLKQKEVEQEKLLRLKAQVELEALQSKINPHFLFNTLNSIASLISVNPAAAEEMVEKFSSLFRYTLRLGDNNNVTLDEELEIVNSYLEIEKLRFGKRLTYEISCCDDVKEVKIPALIIQPLVENSIKHAIASDVNGGNIQVCVEKKEERLEVLVTDTGKGFVETNGGGFGLRSIKERLAISYDNHAQFEIFHNGKTKIRISIPIR